MKTCREVFNCFFFNDTATTEIYTLSLHDALPIYARWAVDEVRAGAVEAGRDPATVEIAAIVTTRVTHDVEDRKSTRLNSSHANISYAVFCLKKKKNTVLS